MCIRDREFLALDAETVTDKLFDIHRDFLNPKYIKRTQVKRMVEKVLSVCGKKDKENKDKTNKLPEIAQNAPPVMDKPEPAPVHEPEVKAPLKASGLRNMVLHEQAPDSERSLPSGLGSQFNDLQSANESIGAKEALENLDINLNEI